MLSTQSEVKIQSVQIDQNVIKLSHKSFAISRQGAPSYSEFRENAQWSISENVKYVAFLEKNFTFMNKKVTKSLWFVYEELAKYIKSRNFRQCKIYHQRMIQKHQSVPQIISMLTYSFPNFQALLLKEREVVKKIQFIRKRQEQKELGQEDYQNSKLKGNIVTAPGYAEQEQAVYDKTRMEEWCECHKLFVEWTKRLSLLMMPKMYL